MTPKETNSQNVWFGVAMFLLGLIAGAVLAFTSGSVQIGRDSIGSAPSAPTAPSGQQPQEPQASVTDRMVAFADQMGLDKGEFETCIADANGEMKKKIDQQTAEGQAAGVSGTPGNILFDMRSKNARVVSGAQPIANFEKQIDAMLADPNAKVTDQSAVAAGKVVPVDLENDYILGDRGAKIAIIEYTDYQCPFCHAVHPTHQQLVKKYDGKVMWVMRHFPLSFHPEAMPLAIGAECAGKLKGNDAFWQFTDEFMK